METSAIIKRLHGMPNWAKFLAAYAAYSSLQQIRSRMNEKDLTGEVVLITGAASGIGRLLAIKMAKLGCRLVLWDLNKEALNKVVEEIESCDGEAIGYEVDITDRELVYSTAQNVFEDFGQVDILINNAGIVSGKKLTENTDRLMEKTMQVNVISHFWMLRAFLPGMIERDHGHIVTISSMAGIAGTPGLVDYCASKFAAAGLAESLRMELRVQKKHGVNSTCVFPFFINTGMFLGAKSSSSLLLPNLEPDYVVKKIITAIKRNEEELIMPRFCKTTRLLKAVFPYSTCEWILGLLGVTTAMNHFEQTRKN